MSYNTNLQVLKKEDLNIIKNLKNEFDIINYVNWKRNDNINDDEIYLAIKYLGKNILQIDYINEELEKSISKKIFINDDLNNLAKNYGHQLFMIEQEDLLLIIKHYQNEILKSFSNNIKKLNSVLKLSDDKNEKGLIDNKENFYRIKDIINTFEYKLISFGFREEDRKKIDNYFPNLVLNQNKKDKKLIVANSNYLEYEIFNLVSLYNNFDFENNVLIVEAS